MSHHTNWRLPLLATRAAGFHWGASISFSLSFCCRAVLSLLCSQIFESPDSMPSYIYAAVLLLSIFTEAPIIFVRLLQGMEAQEGDSATLCCDVSKPDVAVQWKKDASLIQSSKKFEIKKEGTTHALTIHDLKPEDSGEYSCSTADRKTMAKHGCLCGGDSHIHL
uniref:Ig-like domain-containing protein n=1 Tax=Crocodylus porosus TaxID=8502 RepID=A0A7M4FS32_CROPO